MTNFLPVRVQKCAENLSLRSRSLQVISCPGVRCSCPLSNVLSCALREILMSKREGESERGRESMREGGMGNRERERRGKTAACSHPTFYSRVNPIV